LTPNEVEASLLTGIQVNDEVSAEKAGRELLKYGISHIILTLGSLGAMLVNAEKSVRIPTKQVEAVDTTAAGDVFNGAFTYAIAKGEGIENAIRYANAAATLSVTRMGAQPSIPTADEVFNFGDGKGARRQGGKRAILNCHLAILPFCPFTILSFYFTFHGISTWLYNLKIENSLV